MEWQGALSGTGEQEEGRRGGGKKYRMSRTGARFSVEISRKIRAASTEKEREEWRGCRG